MTWVDLNGSLVGLRRGGKRAAKAPQKNETLFVSWAAATCQSAEDALKKGASSIPHHSANRKLERRTNSHERRQLIKKCDFLNQSTYGLTSRSWARACAHNSGLCAVRKARDPSDLLNQGSPTGKDSIWTYLSATLNCGSLNWVDFGDRQRRRRLQLQIIPVRPDSSGQRIDLDIQAASFLLELPLR